MHVDVCMCVRAHACSNWSAVASTHCVSLCFASPHHTGTRYGSSLRSECCGRERERVRVCVEGGRCTNECKHTHSRTPTPVPHLTEIIKKQEVSQHSKYACQFCGKVGVCLCALHDALCVCVCRLSTLPSSAPPCCCCRPMSFHALRRGSSCGRAARGRGCVCDEPLSRLAAPTPAHTHSPRHCSSE